MSKRQGDEGMVQAVELGELQAENGARRALAGRNFDLIKNVKVRVAAQVGSCEISVGELFALQDGGVIKLEQSPLSPVEILLNGQVVARGELVVVDEHFGVRVHELVKE